MTNLRNREILKRADFTKSQARVVVLLMRGQRDSEIATELESNIKTVKIHTVRAYKKIGVGNRYSFMVKLAKMGWDFNDVATVDYQEAPKKFEGGLPRGAA